MVVDLAKIIDETRKVVYKKLDKLVPDDGKNLTKAIRYSLLGGGKRLRPLLVMETAKLFGKTGGGDILTVASAVEMVHTFSLIHDDLPCMDNDDYRRGEPTCHRKFNEYDALLAGDSLIPLATEVILTKTKKLSEGEKNKIVLLISRAIGYRGMCLGQSLDLEFEKLKKQKSFTTAEKINTYKTGYLFKSCIEIGCLLGKANKKDTQILVEYSLNFGKAFQLMDDLEDSEIGEKDIEKTRQKIAELVDNCKKCLGQLKNKNPKSLEILRLIAGFCIKN